MRRLRALPFGLAALCAGSLLSNGCTRSEYSRSVTYKVWGKVKQADIVYVDDNGSNDLPQTRVPWTITRQMEKVPTASVKAGSGDGTVWMSISVDGKAVCEQSSDSGKGCEFALRP